MDRIAYLIQTRFWMFGIPYILLSPFIFYFLFRAPPQPPQRVMPIVFVDANGQTRKLFCGAEDAKDLNMIQLAETTSKNMVNTLFSYPADRAKAASRVIAISKYFSQKPTSSAQIFLKSQTDKILSYADSGTETSFDVTEMKGGFDETKREYIVVIDGVQKTLRNGVETSKSYYIDVTLKTATKERRENESVILEIESIKVRG